MKVRQLIEELKKMPQDADVFHLWDGAPRTEINVIYLARNGMVVTADNGEVCYGTNRRPHDAPTEEEHPYWCTPE